MCPVLYELALPWGTKLPLHGYGFIHEACVQLWGEAGARQVAGDPEVAVAGAGGGPLAGCLLLTRL